MNNYYLRRSSRSEMYLNDASVIAHGLGVGWQLNFPFFEFCQFETGSTISFRQILTLGDGRTFDMSDPRRTELF